MTGSTFHTAFGGKGANQAVMAARLGAQVTVVTRLGRDAFGREVLRNYEAHGIDTRYVTFDDALPSGTSMILVEEPSGRNTIAWVPGANGALSAEDVRAAGEAIAAADVLMCELEVPRPATLEACRIARATHPSRPIVILNVAPIPRERVPDELLWLAHVLVVNEEEAGHLVGISVASPDDAGAAATAMVRRWAAAAIVTLGKLGAVYATADRPACHVPARAVEAVDTTGAGDAFVGTLAYELGSGRPLDLAVRSGVAIATLAVMAAGAQTSYPTHAEAAARLASGEPPASGSTRRRMAPDSAHGPGGPVIHPRPAGAGATSVKERDP
jgi:ribokinase